MSAECGKCGSDLVYADEWPVMFCEPCASQSVRSGINQPFDDNTSHSKRTAAMR